MDHYTFPHITHISQCLKAIEGSPEFIVAERDRHTVINYVAMSNSTFPPVTTHEEWVKMIVPNEETHFRVLTNNGKRYYRREPSVNMDAAIRRECRGIIFGSDGKVIARRFHKFFNAGEHPEVAVEDIDLTKPHVVLDKLDGSMITPIPIGDHIRWGTKMGLTSVGFQAEEFVSTRKNYVEFAEQCWIWGQTPIFEWTSRKQRIVVDYPQDSLTLLAMRDNVTGAYLPYDDLVARGLFWKIPVVSVLPSDFTSDVSHSASKMLEIVRDLVSEIEGYVVRFDDGHMVKLKTDDYVRIHRAKDSLQQEKRVIEMIVSDKCDDVLPHLPPHEKKALESFRTDFWRGVMETAKEISWIYSHWFNKVKGDRKRFALEAEMNREYRGVCFACWGNTSMARVLEELKTRIRKNLGSQTKVDESRWMWLGQVKWTDYIQAEEDTCSTTA